ncbi:MAG: aquaporin [Verrucomicrobiaceae bacterium]
MEKVSRREFVGEVIGTFILVFFGLGSVAVEVATEVSLGLPVIALIWGAAVAVAIYAVGPMSGAHLNPSITLAFACWTPFPWAKVPGHVVAQFVGAMLGALAVYGCFGGAIGEFEKAGGIVRGEAGSEVSGKIFGEYFGEASLVKAMIWEGSGTFLLAFGVFWLIKVTREPRAWGIEKFLPVMIGLWLALLIWLVAPVTQAGFNPARDLGPRLVSAILGWGSWAFEANGWGWFWVYVVAPVVGGLLGGACCRWRKGLGGQAVSVVVGFSLLWFSVVRLSAPARKIEMEGGGHTRVEESVRIGIFNIAHGRGAEEGLTNWEGGPEEERRERMKEIGRLLKAQNLDVIVLNEVDFNCTWSHGVDQAGFLAGELGMDAVLRQRNYDSGVPFFSWEFGNAVLSRYALRDAELVSYPVVRWWEPVLMGKKEGVRVRVGQDFDLMAVHLETRDAGVRRDSLKQLLKAASGNSVLAGDFNAELGGSGETAIDLVRADGRWQAAGGWENGEMFRSYPARNPRLRIDWIFVPKDWEQLGVEVIATELSDHALLVSEWRVAR